MKENTLVDHRKQLHIFIREERGLLGVVHSIQTDIQILILDWYHMVQLKKNSEVSLIPTKITKVKEIF
jgi:hypothetical protein